MLRKLASKKTRTDITNECIKGCAQFAPALCGRYSPRIRLQSILRAHTVKPRVYIYCFASQINTMEWSNDKLLPLIDLYREKPRLWNQRDTEFKIKSKKNDDWAEIDREMECGPLAARKKMESLLSSFRGKRQKKKCKSGAGADDRYESK
ncbi:hypothetical protein PR048_009156 [Dryococelus australis]|uniref:MADF domain-containing protein n=1 Tax=Dryococelus australis TaxID=614101 RepID=A0ABQ9HZ34_9NEOP|nr:hypothetical protein PR048_009156 [Dryococelus australis]